MISDDARKLGEALVAANILSAEQLQKAIEAASKEGSPSLIVGLLDRGLLTFKVFEKFVNKNLGIRSAIIADHVPDKVVVTRIGVETMASHNVFPIAAKEEKGMKTLALGMVDPLNRKTIKYLEAKTGYKIHPMLISLPDFKKAMEKFPQVHEIQVQPVTSSSQKEDFVVIRQGGYEELMPSGDAGNVNSVGNDGNTGQASAGRRATKDINPQTATQTKMPKPHFEGAGERRGEGRPEGELFQRNFQKLQADLMGANRSKFREEVLAKLDFPPVDAQRLTESSYTREILYSHLKNVSPTALQKVYNASTASQKVEALVNALIRSNLLSKSDILISTAVSITFSDNIEEPKTQEKKS